MDIPQLRPIQLLSILDDPCPSHSLAEAYTPYAHASPQVITSLIPTLDTTQVLERARSRLAEHAITSTMIQCKPRKRSLPAWYNASPRGTKAGDHAHSRQGTLEPPGHQAMARFGRTLFGCTAPESEVLRLYLGLAVSGRRCGFCDVKVSPPVAFVFVQLGPQLLPWDGPRAAGMSDVSFILVLDESR